MFRWGGRCAVGALSNQAKVGARLLKEALSRDPAEVYLFIVKNNSENSSQLHNALVLLSIN
jgi:hypothetical protein